MTTASLIVGFALAWFLLPRFITPEEAEEARTPANPEPVTAAVQEGVLREVVQVEGMVEPVESLLIDVPQPANADRPVITYLPADGSSVTSGDVLLGVSDRPVIYLGPNRNLYRDLHRGMTGADVAAFQDFLVDIGHLDIAEAQYGVFGSETEEAVASLYEALGYDVAPPALEYADDDIQAARRRVTQAANALRAERDNGSPEAIDHATHALDYERSKLEAILVNPVLSVPVNEMVGLAYDSVVVVGSVHRYGAVVEAGAPVLEIRTASVVLRATVSRARGAGIIRGHAALVNTPTGRVSTVVEEIDPADDPSLIELVLTWEETSVPGERFLIEVETVRSAGPVMSVPVSAVRTSSDGTAYVTVLESGETRRIPVELGATIGGRTEVTGDLRPGQQVIVSQQ